MTNAEFRGLAEVPAEVEWFQNLDNPRTRAAYKIDVGELMRFLGIATPKDCRDVTRSHILAWRKSLEARALQQAIPHLTLRQYPGNYLEVDENVRNEAEIKRRQDRLDLAVARVNRNGGSVPLPVLKLQHLTQSSVKFIRWVATLLYVHAPWNQAVNKLRASYACL